MSHDLMYGWYRVHSYRSSRRQFFDGAQLSCETYLFVVAVFLGEHSLHALSVCLFLAFPLCSLSDSKDLTTSLSILVSVVCNGQSQSTS